MSAKGVLPRYFVEAELRRKDRAKVASLLLLSALIWGCLGLPNPAFDTPVLSGVIAALGAGVLVAPLLVWWLYRKRRLKRAARELRQLTADELVALDKTSAHAVRRLSELESAWCNNPGPLPPQGVMLLENARKLATALEKRVTRARLLLETNLDANTAQAYLLLRSPLELGETRYDPVLRSADIDERTTAPTLLNRQLEALFDRLSEQMRLRAARS